MNAAMTMVKNEKKLLPVWLNYYQKYFEKLFVLDDGSTDGSIEECQKKFDFEVIPANAFDEEYLNKRVEKVTDILQNGDEVVVKVLDIDKNGKISLSRKAAFGESPGNV